MTWLRHWLELRCSAVFLTAHGEGKLSTGVSQVLQSVWCSMKDFLSNMGDALLFILVQVLYLVGLLLMTFDLTTCGQSQQGSGFLPVV